MCSGSEEGSYLRLIDFVYHSILGLAVIKNDRQCGTSRQCGGGTRPVSYLALLHFPKQPPVYGAQPVLGCGVYGSGFRGYVTYYLRFRFSGSCAISYECALLFTVIRVEGVGCGVYRVLEKTGRGRERVEAPGARAMSSAASSLTQFARTASITTACSCGSLCELDGFARRGGGENEDACRVV